MAGLRICGLWEKKGPNGDVYYEGSFGGTVMRIYANKYKEKDVQPDLVVYLSERPKEKDGPTRAPPTAFQNRPRVTPNPVAPPKGIVKKAVPNMAPNARPSGYGPPPDDFQSEPWPEGPEDHEPRYSGTFNGMNEE